MFEDIVNVTEDDIAFITTVRTAHFWYEIILAVVSIGLNGWVVYLAFTTKNSTMKSFCWVLLMSVSGDIVYALFNLASMVVIEVKRGKMFVMINGPFRHSLYPIPHLLMSLYMMGMFAIIMTIMVQFIYRYYALCKRPMTMTEFVGLYAVGWIWALIEGFSGFVIFDVATDENTAIIEKHPLYAYDTPVYITGDVSVNTCILIQAFFSELAIVSMYVVIIITGRRIHAKLNSNSLNMSKSTKEAQNKLNRVMALQAIYPGVIIGIPICMASVAVQFKMDMPWAGYYIVTSISSMPVINAITVLVGIPSFRRRIFFHVRRREVTVYSSSANVVSHSEMTIH
ncbi:unnamed protein product [Bursaphelenchus okinawaensis]|uniref:G_PROTEIN_RECEP_F1_2 domain-containing protein n=1 Tax=Bursaphelenchus okinawaensis TaxID=465554 RepID=A0A811LTM5_9BILA|nr:unnamed protein product [Bursaphelenchus okinawaensis]CAG9127892.1 unnamed protein product [Bursaphelenchus okinawaensis]